MLTHKKVMNLEKKKLFNIKVKIKKKENNHHQSQKILYNKLIMKKMKRFFTHQKYLNIYQLLQDKKL